MAETNQSGLDIELDEQVAQGHYSNLAIISHSTSEFILDFAVFNISSGDVQSEGFGGFVRAVFVIAGFFGGAAAWWTLLACFISLFRRRFRPRHMLTINHVAGLFIGVLGIYTILSTFFDIFPNVGH